MDVHESAPKVFLPHQQRVVDELNELMEKQVAIKKFIDESDIFKGLDFDEQKRLVNQQFAMEQYASILRERITNF